MPQATVFPLPCQGREGQADALRAHQVRELSQALGQQLRVIAGNVHEQFIDLSPVFGLQRVEHADAIDLERPAKCSTDFSPLPTGERRRG